MIKENLHEILVCEKFLVKALHRWAVVELSQGGFKSGNKILGLIYQQGEGIDKYLSEVVAIVRFL